MNSRFVSFVRLSLFFVLLGGMVLQPQSTAYALTTLTVEPLTWNVIGLDSNNVNVGPNHFPVGVRVCNTGSEAATNVTTTWVWDSNNSYIDIRNGTLYPDINLGTLNAGACADAYYEVEVDRDSNAYDTTREYHIEVNAGNVTGTISTPTPRELYVEYLISQSRNYVRDIKLDGVSIPAGGTMTLMVGQTYDITINGSTATQGYNQLEEFINIPNVIFQVLAVNTVYSAPPPPSVNPPNPTDKLYGDACTWENNPSSPNYRSCVGSDYKNGGDVDITYTVRILQVPGTPFVNPQPLSTLIYDFSGSSYHYNSDYDVSTRYAYIINASIIKSFSPKTINPGGTSTLTFTINNPGPDAITGVHFSDTLPGNVVLTANATTPQCGGTVTGGSGTNLISLTGGTIAGYSTCTVTVTVTASTDGTYNNTSDNLFIDTSVDTGSFATDSLVVSSQPSPPTSCGSPSTMATWTLENYTASTALQNGPFSASSQAGNVTTATGTYGAQSGSSSGIADTTTFPTGWAVPSTTGNSGNSWGIRGAWLSSNPAAGTEATVSTPYFQFQVDASNYGGIGITSNYNLQGNWSNAGNWYVLTSTNGATWSLLNSGAWDKSNAWQTGITGTTTLTGNTTVYFRIYAAGAQYGGNPSVTTGTMYLDGITITGCPRPVVPTLSKSFSPTTIAQGSASTLTFTFGNPNTTALSAISFSDTLPTGLVIDTPNGLSAISCTTGSVVTAPTITATAGTSTIRLTGLQLSASASCSFSVSVEGTTAGAYTNISGNITSTSTGPNTTPTGYGTSSLTVVAPPVINKAFTANPIFTGNTTTLTFSINNPNTAATLIGITFTDTLPAGLTVTNSSSAQCNGTLTVTAPDTISLSGGSLVAGASCSFSVTVTGTTVGLKTNSVQVDSANGGTGNTSTADMLVKNPTPAIGLLKSVGPSNSGPWTPTLSVTLPGSVYYRFIVENIGDVLLTAVDVTDPNVNIAGCSWVDGDGTALVARFNLPIADANDNQLAICILGPITALDGANPNTATADDNNPGLPVQDTSTATYTGFAPNLGLAKTNSATSVTAGGTTNYTLTVTNSGNLASSGTITIVDVLPTGLSIADGAITEGGANAADWTCNSTSNVITCTSNIAIAASGNSVFSFTANVDPSASGTLLNRAQVGGGGDPTNPNPPSSTTAGQCAATNTPNEGCATDSDTVNVINLSLAKTNGVTAVTAGGTTTYSLTVTNSGNAASSGIITIVDVLPTGLSVANGAVTLGGAQAANWTCTAASNVITCASTTAIAGSDGTSVFSFTVNVDANASGTLINRAQVGGGGDPTNPAPPSSTTAGQCTGTNTPNEGCAMDSDTVNVIADLEVTKTDGTTAVVSGSATTYTIVVTNRGPSSADNSIFTDPIIANINVTGVTCGSETNGAVCPSVANTTVVLMQGAGIVIPTLPSGGSVTFTVNAILSGSGSLTNTANVTPPGAVTDPGVFPNSASDTNMVVLIDAVNDAGSSVNGYTGGQSFANVLVNDTLNGNPVTLATVNLTQVSTTNPNVTLNVATGAVNVAPGTPAGNYTVTYQICDQANPTICDTATVTVPVSAAVIDAVDDDYSATPVNGFTGGNAGNAFSNDTLNGVAVVPAQITATVITPASDPGVTLNMTTGSVDVAAGTPAGTYTIDYQICENINPTNCDTATITVVVNPPMINAVNDDYSGTPVNGDVGGNAGNAFSNDTLNGVAVVSAQITATILTPASDPGVTTNTATGSVDVAAGTPAGTYTIDYQICENLNPTNCDTATITVVVNPPPIDAVNDDYGSTPVNGYVGGNAGNAFSNDTLNGLVVVPAQITATIITPASDPGVTLSTATGSVDVAAGTPAGTYTIDYQICETLNPTNCDTATITVVVNPPPINAVDDDYSATPVNGYVGGNAGNAFSNDTLNGVAVVPSQITATILTPASNPGVTMNIGTGSVDVAAGTPAGTYTIDYQICENLNPSNCDIATITVVVNPPVINAVNDDYSGTPVNGYAGGNAGNAFSNDTLNGVAVVPAQITTTIITPASNPGVTLNTGTGSVDVAAGTPAGTYTIDYQICENLNSTNCDSATITVVVNPPAINAVDDDYSATPVNGYVGGNAGNAFGNDTLNGVAVVPAQVTATIITPASNPGVTLNIATGSVDVATGTPAGTYTIDYQICENLNPMNCDTATITVAVNPPVINAMDDDYSATPVNGLVGGNAGNAFINDTLNGLAVVPAQITTTIVTPASNPGVTLNTATGSVDVAAGTPAGTYTIDYQICENLNPNNCDTATITVAVNPPVIDAVNDDYSGTPISGLVGGNAGNAFSNDTLNGVPVVSAQITATVITPASDPGVTLNTATGSVDVAAGTPAGTYTVDYQICENLNPTNCDTATITVVVAIPGISLTKTPTLDMTVVAPNGTVNAGDTITYVFSVQNTSSVTITNLVITDPLLPTLSCNIASLAPGATASCAATNNIYTLTQVDIDNGSRANTASVTGNDPGGNPVTDTDTSTVTLTPSPSILLTKTPALDDTVVVPGGVVNAGDTITYSFSVQNTGNVTITNITLSDTLLGGLNCTAIASLAPGASQAFTCTGNTYILTQADVDAGSRANTATAMGQDPSNNLVTDPDTQTTTLNQSPDLNIVKEVSTDNLTWNDVSVNVMVGDTVYYRVRVANTGNVTLTNLVVDDGMTACTLVRGTDLNGDNDANFEAGEEWAYTCSVTSVAGTNDNTATADTTETLPDSDTASYAATVALVADPALSKAGSPSQASVGDTVVFTLTVTNAGNTAATGVMVTDSLPAMFDVTAVAVSGTTLPLVNVTPPIGTGPAPYTVVVTLNSPVGVSDVVTITITTMVNSLGNPPINNTGSLSTTGPNSNTSNDSDTVAINIQSSGTTPTGARQPLSGQSTLLPATGFAPEVVTQLAFQPHSMMYAATDVMLEIPSLGVKIPIVGVPKKNGTWDVSWLGRQAGWLEGSAFPSWSGNSLLTSHVYDSNGLPGPFVNLHKLKYGDQIIVHAYGQKYIFEVQSNQVVAPNDTSAFKHEEKSWLTLITCKEYDEKTNSYKQRVVVRAVLVKVVWDK